MCDALFDREPVENHPVSYQGSHLTQQIQQMKGKCLHTKHSLFERSCRSRLNAKVWLKGPALMGASVVQIGIGSNK